MSVNLPQADRLATIPEIDALYRAMLGRSPESDATIEFFSALPVGEVIQAISGSDEFRERNRSNAASPFRHYFSMFDAEAVIRSHAASGIEATPGRLTNFLGVKIDPAIIPTILGGREGTVEGIPIPANWHADIAEWAAVFRAVDLARGSFTVMELGCAWGCWLNNAGAAARRRGLSVNLIGVEGDEGHAAMAYTSTAENGFRADQVTIHRGIAAASSGVALFPRGAAATENYGFAPIFGADDRQVAEATASGNYDLLQMLPLSALVQREARVDLLHVDIQGGEADVVHGSMEALSERVAYLMIGTHSRVIEGQLCADLLGAGWRLEIERPAIVEPTADGPVLRVDGVQGWRNVTLLPDA